MRAKEALTAVDSKTADKFFKQAVGVPSEFVSWIIQHVGVTLGASIVVANYSMVALLALEPGRARRAAGSRPAQSSWRFDRCAVFTVSRTRSGTPKT